MEIIDFNPYSIPAIIALVLKFLLLGATSVMPLRNSEAKVFLAFLFVLALHNAAEIMGLNYSGPKGGMIDLRSGILFFTMSIIAMAILLHLMLIRLRESTGWNVAVEDWRCWLLLYAPAAGVLLLLWMSNSMIQGFVPQGFSYTRVPGPQYHWFELYALVYLVASIGILVVSTLASRNRVSKRKNIIILAGMTPIITMPIAVILLQKYGVSTFNLPLWFPLGVTFFLVVAAYAIHEHRLFNVFFHLPGTRMRRRRTIFHQGIKHFVAEMDRLPDLSVEQALDKLAKALKCSVAIVGAGRSPVEAGPGLSSVHHLRTEKLERDKLKDIDHIVVTRELRREDPESYSALSRANCAAVIPFRPFRGTSAGWLLLGGGERAPDELPVDFALVESLFDRMGDLFLENIIREREALSGLEQELEHQRAENDRLATELKRKEDAIDALYNDYATAYSTPGAAGVNLDELTAGLEKKVITDTLASLKGNVSATAKTLGLTRQTLYAKMDSYGIDSDRWRQKRGRRRKQQGGRRSAD